MSGEPARKMYSGVNRSGRRSRRGQLTGRCPVPVQVLGNQRGIIQRLALIQHVNAEELAEPVVQAVGRT